MIGRFLGRGSVPLSRLANLRALSPRERFFQVANALLVPVLAERLHVAHVVEFPKCGGSWVRNSILTYLGKTPNVNARLVSRDDVLHGHRLHRSFYRWPIIVVRDPRDTYASLFHHETTLNRVRDVPTVFDRHFRRTPGRDLRDEFADYLEVRLRGRFHPYFTYSDFVESWLDRPGICLVRYEDMLARPEAELSRILAFLGLAADPERVRAAVAENSFANQTRRLYGSERAPGQEDATKFLRKGVSGDWKNHFDERSCRIFWEVEGGALRRLGYAGDRGWIDDFVRERRGGNAA